MPLHTDLMVAGLPAQGAVALGVDDLTDRLGSQGAIYNSNINTLSEVGDSAFPLSINTPLSYPVYFSNPNAETAVIRPPGGCTLNGNAVQLSLAQNQSRLVIRIDQTRFISWITA